MNVIRSATACFLAGVALLPFSVYASGSITGGVTNTVNAPVAGMWVLAYDPATNWIASELTETNGTYAITNLSNGTYYLQTYDLSGFYIDEWYDDIPVVGTDIPPEAAAVHVSNGVAPNINFILAKAGSISGQVTSVSGPPLSNVWVDAYDSGGTIRKSAISDDDGAYAITGLPEGVFYVRTDVLGQSYVDEWFDDVPVTGYEIPAAAAGVVVIEGVVTAGIDFALTAAAAILGTVAADDDGPLTDVWVDAYSQDGDWQASAVASTGGAYRVDGLPPETYFVRTYVGSANYVDEWFDDVPVGAFGIPSNATPLPLTAGATASNVDFSLAKGASISGVLTNSAGSPIGEARVDVYDTWGEWVKGATSASSGNYSVAGLPAGSFLVRTGAADLNYVDEWYDNVAAVGGAIPDDITLVALTSGASVAGVNFGLAEGGIVTGRVADTNDVPLQGVTVSVYDGADNWLRGGTTASNGIYAVRGLPPPGPFFAVTESDPLNYADRWHNGIPAVGYGIPDGVSPFYVVAGGTASNIDFVLPPGGIVSGTVTGGAVPLAGVDVALYAADGGLIGRGATAFDGNYEINGLPAGAFRIRTDAAALGYVDEWFDDVLAFATLIPSNAESVAVWPGLETTNISFDLQEGGSITGRVTDTGATPLSGVGIDVYNAGSEWVKGATTDSNGDYRMPGVATQGVYCVRTYVGDANYLDEWFDDVLVSDGSLIPPGAFPFIVSAGSAVNAGFMLAQGGVITGRVTDAVGSPLAGIGVDVYGTNGVFVGTEDTAADGRYWLTRIAPGAYYLRTFSGSAGFADEWHDNVPVGGATIPSEATPLTLGVEAATNADFQLQFLIVDCGTASNGLFRVRWQAASGSTYRVEQALALTVPSWSNAPSGSNAVEQSLQTAPGQTVMEYQDAFETPSNSFYRLRVVDL